MEIKIQKAIHCLYAVAGVQMLGLIYSILSFMELKSEIAADALSSINPVGFVSAAHVWPLLILAVIYFVVQNLRKENEWAWVGALSVFVFTLPSFAIVFSALGILFLLDRDVRSQFLAKLDIKL